ncbi:VOC family protein [Chitinophagaceae bacterium LWZ2-11]
MNHHNAGSKITNRTMPSCTIIPVLAYEDVTKAVDWLCKTFGFKERWRAGSHRAQLTFGSGTIAVTEQQVSQANRLGSINNWAQHSLLVQVPDVMRHYNHVKESGAHILQPPVDYPYGERQYSVEDIGGHIWVFSESIADTLPEDWGGISGDLSN